jgi:hypothetical protein
MLTTFFLFKLISLLIGGAHALFGVHAIGVVVGGAIHSAITLVNGVQNGGVNRGGQVNSGMANTGAIASVNDLANAMQQIGVMNLGGGSYILPVPQNQTFTVTSAYNASATAFTMYAFNEDYLNATPTNNGAGGSGGGTVTRTYTDGSNAAGSAYNGTLISRVLGAYTANKGATIYGFDIQYTSGTSQLPSALGSANIIIQYNNGDGTTTPLKIDITSARRNTQFISGELTILKKFNMSRFAQWTGLMPAATTASNANVASVIFYTMPQGGQTAGIQ